MTTSDLVIAVYNTQWLDQDYTEDEFWRLYWGGNLNRDQPVEKAVWRRMGWITNPVSVSGTVRFNALGNFAIVLSSDDPMVPYMMNKTARVSFVYKGEYLMSGKVRNPAGGILKTDQITFQVQSDWRVLQNNLAHVNPLAPLSATQLSGVPTFGQYWRTDGYAGNPDSFASANGWTVSQLTGYWNRAVIQALIDAGNNPGIFPSDSGVSAGNPANLAGTIIWNNLIPLAGYVPPLDQSNANGNGTAPEAFRTTADDAGGYLGIEMGISDDNRGIDPSEWPDLAADYWPNVRFSTIEAAVQPILAQGDYGLLVRPETVDGEFFDMGGASMLRRMMRYEFYSPQVWQMPLTPESGVITGGSWSLDYPTATRATIGGPGEDAARIFRGGRDSAREREYDDVIDVWKDATGADLKWPSGLDQTLQNAVFYLLRTDVAQADKDTLVSYLTTTINGVLSDGQATSSLSATLSETPGFHYGGDDGYHLGDRMTVQTAQGLRFSERVESVDFSLTASDGLKVTPHLGDIEATPERKTAQAIASLVASLQRISKSR